MKKKFSFGLTALSVLCLAALACPSAYRAVENYISDRLKVQLCSEAESVLQELQATVLQQRILLKKAAQEAEKYWINGNTGACHDLPARYVASYDAATGMGLYLPADALPDRKALGVYAFRDEERPLTFEEFPADVDTSALSDPGGSSPILWLPFRRHSLTGVPTVTAICPIRTTNREWTGILTSDLAVFELQKLVTARGLPPSLTADILDGTGTVLASSRPAALMRPMVQSQSQALSKVIDTILAERSGNLVYEEGAEATRVVFDTLPETGWKVCMRSRVREDFQNLRWFWVNDVRIYSCCGFHTLRRAASPADRGESDFPSPGREAKTAPQGRHRRFAPGVPQ